MEHRIKINLMGATLALAGVVGASVVTSTIVVARSVERRSKVQAENQREVSVKGSARMSVRSDRARWRIVCRADGQSLKAAFASLEVATNEVRNFLADRGFAPEQVALDAIDTRTFYAMDKRGEPTRTPEGYRLERAIVVTTTAVDAVAGAAGEVTQLIRNGLQIVSELPEFTLSTLPEVRIKIVGDAGRDAMTRAEEIVNATGARVGVLKDLRVGPIQITPPLSTDVDGGGRYDTSTIDKDVVVAVNAVFAIDSNK